MEIEKVAQNILGIHCRVEEFTAKVADAFQGYEYKGTGEVTIAERQASVNYPGAPIIRYETEMVDDQVQVTDAWVVKE